ncbi:MAG: DUF1344 domain-containing protein [Pseudomonadota bacterium]
MKKLLTSILVGATLAGSSIFAFAGEGEGVISAVDPATRTIILEDGSQWVAAEDVDIAELAAGDTIMVTFEDGTTTLTSVTKVQ